MLDEGDDSKPQWDLLHSTHYRCPGEALMGVRKNGTGSISVLLNHSVQQAEAQGTARPKGWPASSPHLMLIGQLIRL